MRALALSLVLVTAACNSGGGSTTDAAPTNDAGLTGDAAPAADAVGNDVRGQEDAGTGTCLIVVHPASGAPTAVFEVMASGFPAGTMTKPTNVLLEFTSPKGVMTNRTFLTLAAGATAFTYKFHEQENPQEPVPPPLEAGTWHILGEDEAHTCTAQATFVVM